MKCLLLLLSFPLFADLIEELPPESPLIIDTGTQELALRVLFSMGAILLLLLLVFLFLRKMGGASLKNNHGRNIKILDKRALSNQTILYHVEIGDQQFLLAESKLEIETVAKLDWQK